MLEATFRFALRTRWKLALCVFLLGATLAALARSMDVNPYVTDASDMREIMEAAAPMGPAGSVPGDAATATVSDSAVAAAPDQAAPPLELQAVGRTMVLLAVSGVISLAFSLGATLFGLLVVGRMVAGERESGAVMLWAQHPGSLPGFYAKRYGALQVANVAVQLAFGLTVAAAALGPGGSAGFAMRAFMEPFATGLLAAAVSFGLSALGMRRNAFAGLAYILLSQLAGSLFVGPLAPLTTGAWETVATIAPYVIFPGNAVTEFAAGFRSGWNWEATGLIFYHFILWSALAWLGLRRVARRPLRL